MHNALFMANQGFKVFAADLSEQIDKLRDGLGLITLNVSWLRMNLRTHISTWIWSFLPTFSIS